MHMASWKPHPVFDGHTATCQRCRQTTQLTKSQSFLEKANALWPAAEVTLRASKRVLSLIEQHDEYLKARGDYDIITATLDENWTGEEHVDEPDAE
jgi:hypothetical protein